MYLHMGKVYDHVIIDYRDSTHNTIILCMALRCIALQYRAVQCPGAADPLWGRLTKPLTLRNGRRVVASQLNGKDDWGPGKA